MRIAGLRRRGNSLGTVNTPYLYPLRRGSVLLTPVAEIVRSTHRTTPRLSRSRSTTTLNGSRWEYQDLITLTRRIRSIRSQNIEILHQSNSNRVIAFKRWTGDEDVIIVASLNDRAFANGYAIEQDLVAIPNAGWKEIFNSDNARYGGQNVGNGGGIAASASGRLDVVIPAAGLLVFARQ